MRSPPSRFPFLLAAAVVLIAVMTAAGGSLIGAAPHASTTAAGASPSGAESVAALVSAPRAAVDYLSGAPSTVVRTGTYEGSASVFVTFSLTNQTELNALLANLVNPQSAQYHHYLTAGQFDARFSPAATPYQDAQAYFGSFPGIHVISYADRIGMLVEGPAASVDTAFGVSLGSYFSAGRGTYYAPTGVATLPAPIASAVVQLEGLSSYLDAQTTLAGSAHLANVAPSLGGSDGYPAPQDCSGAQCLYGSDLQVAYDEQALLNVTFPTGEQVATILWAGCTESTSGTCPVANLTGGYDPNDVYSYYNATLPAGEPHSNVIGVPFDGAPSPGVSATFDVSGAVFENTLDLDMVGSLAPGSTVYNVYGVSSLDSETDAALGYVLNNLPQVNVITNSWGAQDHTDGAWNSYLQSAAARGITVLASSGDAGDSPFSSRWDGSATEFPSSVGFDDYGVIGVGGTTLTVNDDAFSPDYLHTVSQIVWYDPVYNFGTDQVGSSGGVSPEYTEPSWQLSSEAASVIAAKGVGEQRGVPDLAATGNNTIIFLSSNGGSPQVYTVWGTSVASPVTAGMFAEIDAVLERYAQPAVGFVDPTLYTWGDQMVAPLVNTSTTGYVLTGNWHSSLPALPFDDITVGGNFDDNALPGYDLVTGWGSLDAYNFTDYILSYNYSGESFSLNGVGSVLSLSGLNVTSLGVPYNASVQQNFFLANSLGAPLYWVQNVIYIAGSPSAGWAVNYTGWVVFPFYGLYPSDTVYEYNFPLVGANVTTPISWTIASWLINNGPNAMMNFRVDNQNLQLPVPGAAFIIGGYNYQYYWQGNEYTNGPFPNNFAPGGLAPQFGLVGGPSAGQGDFMNGTAGTLSNGVEMSGQGQFVAAPFGSPFSGSVDQTGEIANNLAWSGSGASWTVTQQPGASDQGVVTYTVLNAGNPANHSAPEYDVNFTESGLVPSSAWSVTFDGQTQSCTVGLAGGACSLDSMTFMAPNGVDYAFAVNATGYSANPATGSLTVNGANVDQDISFQVAATYTVEFTQSGLAPGTLWNVTLGGVPQSTRSPSMDFSEPNGPYSFTANASGYSANPSSGMLTVNGADVHQSIDFTAAMTYSIRFSESGLSGGITWSITLTGYGTHSNQSGGAIVFEGLTNGNYPFSVGQVSGYNASPSSGSVSVTNQNATQSISFSGGGGGGGGGFSLPPFTLFGLSGLFLYEVIIGIVVVCVAVAVTSAVLARRRPPAAAAIPAGAEGAVPPGPGPAAGSVPPPGVAPAPSLPAAGPTGTSPVPEINPPPPTRTCPDCGAPVGATSRFCPNCGKPLG